jgi:hypothetical protein
MYNYQNPYAYPAPNFGPYGVNPHYTLAESSYARMTGLFTPLSSYSIPNLNSFLQPMFIDMNPYFGNTGVPRYASFIGSGAMQNPDIPIVQPGQMPGWQGDYGQGYGQNFGWAPEYGFGGGSVGPYY